MTEGICRQRFINQVGFVNPAVCWRFTTVCTSHYVINQATNVRLSVFISITDITSHMGKPYIRFVFLYLMQHIYLVGYARPSF